MNRNYLSAYTPARIRDQPQLIRQGPGTSISKILLVVFMLTSGFILNLKALVATEEIQLPNVQGWTLTAVRTINDNSITCRARRIDENGVSIILFAATGKYRGGIWFLEIVSPNQHLKPDVQESLAHLSLNGKPAVEGKALAVSDMIGNTTTARYVRFEFPAIDAYIDDIEAARSVEVQAVGLISLKIETLSPIIALVRKYLSESSDPSFWKNAKSICN